MILSILENNQSSSKPHINNKDLKQPYLSTCERFGHELHEPIKNFIYILSTPISILPKSITTFQCSKGSVSHVARFVKRTFNSSTMRALITCIGYHPVSYMVSPLYADENIPTWKDRRPPFLWNSWRRTIKTHTVKNSEINETFASEKRRQEKDINRNWARN